VVRESSHSVREGSGERRVLRENLRSQWVKNMVDWGRYENEEVCDVGILEVVARTSMMAVGNCLVDCGEIMDRSCYGRPMVAMVSVWRFARGRVASGQQ
jgi:hypothetical protein